MNPYDSWTPSTPSGRLEWGTFLWGIIIGVLITLAVLFALHAVWGWNLYTHS